MCYLFVACLTNFSNASLLILIERPILCDSIIPFFISFRIDLSLTLKNAATCLTVYRFVSPDMSLNLEGVRYEYCLGCLSSIVFIRPLYMAYISYPTNRSVTLLSRETAYCSVFGSNTSSCLFFMVLVNSDNRSL